MKTKVIITISLFLSLLLTGREKELVEVSGEDPRQLPPGGKPSDLPDGYLEVTSSIGYGGADTRMPVTGTDSRVRHPCYVIYKSIGKFVKEKVVLKTTDVAPPQLMAALKDMLPKGWYTAVFLANVEKMQFPIPVSGGGTDYADVLMNCQATRMNAQIVLSGMEFTDTLESYLANVSFSDTSAQPYILLQRIISILNLRGVFVDAQTVLNSLTNNIATQVGHGNIARTTVQGVLPGLPKAAMDLGVVGNVVYNVVDGLDVVVNLVVAALLEPVVGALYVQLLRGPVNQIGLTLSGNATQNGALGVLDDLLNPWGGSDAVYALVTINNFPKAADLDLNAKDFYMGNHRFRYRFTPTPGTTDSEKDTLIRGLHGLYDVREIHVAKPGLIPGLLVDDVTDGPLLLNGVFVNIVNPIQVAVNMNYRYHSNYLFVSLGLKSYAQQNDGNHSLTLSVQLRNIANLDGILGGILLLGPVLNRTVKLLIGNITVTVPASLPLLGIDNLTLSGSWSTPSVRY